MKIALKEEEDKQVLRKRRTPRSMTHGTFLAHNDARSIKKDGWIDTGVSEGWNKNHTKWTISRVKSKSFGLPWGHSKRFATWGCKNFLLGVQCLTLILGVYRFMHDDLQTKLCLSYRLENRTWPTKSLVGHEQDSKSLILKCQLVFFSQLNLYWGAVPKFWSVTAKSVLPCACRPLQSGAYFDPLFIYFQKEARPPVYHVSWPPCLFRTLE